MRCSFNKHKLSSHLSRASVTKYNLASACVVKALNVPFD